MWGTIQTYAGKETHSEVFKNHQIFDFHEAMDDIVPINDFLGRPARFFSHTGPFVKEFLVDLTLFGERSQKNAIKAIDDLIGEGKCKDEIFLLINKKNIYKFFNMIYKF